MFRILALTMFYSGQRTGLELCKRRISFSDCQLVKEETGQFAQTHILPGRVRALQEAKKNM
jgi:hypothetical protein